MKNVLVVSLIAASALLTSTVDAQNQLWLQKIGTSVNDVATALGSDDVGGAILTGSTGGSLGGPNAGGGDVWLARYDAAGNKLWITQSGTSQDEIALDLAPDGSGGAVIAGRIGPYGSTDALIARYDNAGNELWARQFGTGELDEALAVASDGAGGAIVAGTTHGSLGGAFAGGYGDCFIARYDSDGNQLWIRQFGTSGSDQATALASDGEGGVVIAVMTSGSLGGPNAGDGDVYLARYDSAGNRLWERQFGTFSFDNPTVLLADSIGGVTVAGYTGGDLGGPPAGGFDGFLAHYDSAGNQLWIHQFGSNESDYPYALAHDGAGGLIVAGQTSGDLGGPNAGARDAFLVRFNGAHNQLWVTQFGELHDEEATGLVLDGVGGVMVAGTTRGSLGGPIFGGIDAYLASYTIGESCYADCDQSTGNGVLDVFDFLCFQNSFVSAEPYACDCDTSTGNGVCDVFDFLCFQNAFVGGCP